MISFIPGHPFKTRKQFNKTFARREVTGSYSEPSLSKRNRLIKFLQAFVVSRPVTLLNLKGLRLQYQNFRITEDDESIVAYYTKKCIDALRRRQSSRLYTGDMSTSDSKAFAMICAIRAQQHCANNTLIQEQMPTNEEILRAQGRRLVEKFKTVKSKQLKDDELEGIFRSMARQFREGENRSLVPEEDLANEGENLERMPAIKKLEVLAAEQPVLTVYSDVTAQPPEDRAKWLTRVHSFSDKQLYSPKVVIILQLLKHIHSTWPNEQVVIFSRLLKFLDILDEAIRRDPYLSKQKITPLRFDSTLDTAERLRVRAEFSSPQHRNVMLITPGAGGAGMNLTAASKVIQCEPWWNATDEAQAFSRCWRMGQEKEVHVWVIRGCNSLIDFLLMETRDKKMATNIEIVRPLRHADDHQVIIPRQYKHGSGE